MKKNLLQRQSRQAFTLIELSFVIIVISVIIAGMVSIMSSKIANEKNRTGNENFTTIYQALGKFLLTNKRLPCPASLIQSKTSSATYGVEISATNCVAAGVYQSNSNTNLVYGMVPTQSLGLGSDLAEDAYGSKIVYVVDKRLTTTSGNSFESNIANSSMISITGGASISNALFVLISRGANKSGAYAANSSAVPTASSNSDELKNDAKTSIENIAPTPSTSGFDGTFVQSSSVADFDDVIFYKTEEQLLSDYNAWSLIPCTSASSTESLYETTVTWPKAYAGQIVAASTACPSPNWNGSVAYPAKKCGDKGIWGSVIKPCTCSSGYSGGSCASNGCSFSGVTGIADGTPVSSGSGSISCDSGYSGIINYTCSGGVVTPDSGSCTLYNSCSGGDSVTIINVSGANYRLHVFNSNGTFSCPTSRNVQVLAVGGGGGGGADSNDCAGNGGGGGGGVVYNSSFAVTTTPISVTVGNGGAGGTPAASGGTGNNGTNGSRSIFSSITAYGGGGGGARRANGSRGASGGGGGMMSLVKAGGSAIYGSQGKAGGTGQWGAGGGGGAGAVGSNGSSSSGGAGGNGGAGASYNIIGGSGAYYGGGGGGGYYYCGSGTPNNAKLGTGGNGGGGTAGSNGTNNTGGGGGGNRLTSENGGTGGSGVVIIRYPN